MLFYPIEHEDQDQFINHKGWRRWLIRKFCTLLGIEIIVMYRYRDYGSSMAGMSPWYDGRDRASLDMPKDYNRIDVRPVLHIRTKEEKKQDRVIREAIDSYRTWVEER